MRIEPRTLTESNINPKGYRNVVVEGYTPDEVMPFLENCFVVFQNTEEEYYGDVFTCGEGVLNALKPNLFVCKEPSEGDVNLCKTFDCEIINLQKLDELANTKEVPLHKMATPLDLENLDVLSLADGEVSESLTNSFGKIIDETPDSFGSYNGQSLNHFNN